MGDTSPIGYRRTKYADSAKGAIAVHNTWPKRASVSYLRCMYRRYLAYRIQTADHTRHALSGCEGRREHGLAQARLCRFVFARTRAEPMKKTIAAISLVLLSLSATAQAPVVDCPVHHVPANFTGRTRTDGSGRTTAYEYCDSGSSRGHCFWGHN
jgi:hypothetical protein